jgi:hypothetical protein
MQQVLLQLSTVSPFVAAAAAAGVVANCHCYCCCHWQCCLNTACCSCCPPPGNSQSPAHAAAPPPASRTATSSHIAAYLRTRQEMLNTHTLHTVLSMPTTAVLYGVAKHTLAATHLVAAAMVQVHTCQATGHAAPCIALPHLHNTQGCSANAAKTTKNSPHLHPCKGLVCLNDGTRA